MKMTDFNKLHEVSHLVLRVVIGFVFFLHGLEKVQNIGMIQGMLTGMNFPAPELMGWVLALSELICGALLILGLVTRLATIPLMIAMLLALLVVHLPYGFSMAKGGFEYVLALLGALFVLMTAGSSKVSLDHLLFKGKM